MKKFEVTIEVAEDCQCPDQQKHSADCLMHNEWIDKGRFHSVDLQPTIIGPNGHLMYTLSSDNRLGIYNMLVDYCGGDIEQALHEMDSIIDVHSPVDLILDACGRIDAGIQLMCENNAFEAESDELGEISHITHRIRIVTSHLGK